MEPRSTNFSSEAGARFARGAEEACDVLGTGAAGGGGGDAASLGLGLGGGAGGFGGASLRVDGAGASGGDLAAPPTRARAAEARTLPGSCSITRPYTAAALSRAPDWARASPRPR